MNRNTQTVLLAVLVFTVFSPTATYVTANFDSLGNCEEGVISQRFGQFIDIREMSSNCSLYIYP